MKLVYICSPLKGVIKENKEKAIDYCRFSSTKNVIPLAPHTIFTQYLDDTKKDEREKGLKMGLELLKKCNEIWVFGDKISEGMKEEIKLAKKLKITVRLMQKEYDKQKAFTFEDCIKNSSKMDGKRVLDMEEHNTEFERGYRFFYAGSGGQDSDAVTFQEQTGWKRIWASDMQGANGDIWIVYRNANDLPKWIQDYAKEQEILGINQFAY